MFEQVRGNELNYMFEQGWFEEGTATDAGKYRLSAKGLKQYDRLVESLAAQQQVLEAMKVAANAYKTKTEIKAFMK